MMCWRQRLACGFCVGPVHLRRTILAMPHLISSRVKSQQKGVPGGNVWSLLLPWPKIYKACLQFPAVLLAAFFCLCFEVWICNSDDDEPLKDLSRSRNWEDFFPPFPPLGGTLLSGLGWMSCWV